MLSSMLSHLALSFLVCKLISYMNFPFVIYFMPFKCFCFVLFGTLETDFAQLQACISFTDCWRVFYSHDAPDVSLCLISYNSISALQLVCLPFKSSALTPNPKFSALHCCAKISMSVDLYHFGSTLRFLRERKSEYFSISFLQDKENSDLFK